MGDNKLKAALLAIFAMTVGSFETWKGWTLNSYPYSFEVGFVSTLAVGFLAFLVISEKD